METKAERPNSVFLVQDTAYLQDDVYVRDFPVPLKIPALTVIKITAYATQAGAEVSASWSGWIET